MVLATALFGKPAFRNLICNGLVLAEDGKKMSKSLKNYPSPMEVINDYGAVVTSKSLYFMVSYFIHLDWHVTSKCMFCLTFFIIVMTSLQFDLCYESTVMNYDVLFCWIGCLAFVPYKLPCCACRATSFQEGRSLWCCQYHPSGFIFCYLVLLKYNSFHL